MPPRSASSGVGHGRGGAARPGRGGRDHRLYRSDEQVGQLVGLFGGFALFVAGLGLFGLASFTTERRTKEVGVRKVLGASTASIVLLLSRDFAALVLVAVGVAAPVAYVALGRWPEGFAYRVELGWVPFLLAELVALAVALLTVRSQALRAASADPAKALRSE